MTQQRMIGMHQRELLFFMDADIGYRILKIIFIKTHEIYRMTFFTSSSYQSIQV